MICLFFILYNIKIRKLEKILYAIIGETKQSLFLSFYIAYLEKSNFLIFEEKRGVLFYL